MILLAYDGSVDAQAAIERAAQLMPGADATVLTVWRPFMAMALTSGEGMGVGLSAAYADPDKIDAISREVAVGRAAEGAGRAAAAGLNAHPRVQSAIDGMARTVLAAAADVDADLIVLGTRGLHGAQSFFLGSVSHGVLQHADRPVVIVPSPRVIEHRREWFETAVAG
jgi:nucleotide-binding universal stress UspA family protein